MIENPTMIVICKSTLDVRFLYFTLCPKVNLDSLSFSFISIAFFYICLKPSGHWNKIVNLSYTGSSIISSFCGKQNKPKTVYDIQMVLCHSYYLYYFIMGDYGIINILPLVQGVTVDYRYHKKKKYHPRRSRVWYFFRVLVIYRNTLNQRQYVLYYTECPSEGGIAEDGIAGGGILAIPPSASVGGAKKS